MTDTTNTAESGAGAVAPATPSETPVPQVAEQVELTPEQKAEAEQADAARKSEEKKRNRTRDYIASLQRRVAELESRQAPPQQAAPSRPSSAHDDEAPQIADFNDFNAYQQARDAWVLEQAEKRFQTATEQRAHQAREQELWHSYESRAADFASDHDDFFEVVGSMPPLPPALQAAIAANPNGPAIAYHLASNPSDLLQFAAVPPHFAEWATQQVAARLGAAPAPQQNAAPAPAPTKPISQAPPPVPTVGGRAPASRDPDRMTTDEWLAWRQNQLKKG